MFRFFKAAPLLITLIVIGMPHAVRAHELVPAALIEYVKSHPDATAQEIQAYAQEKVPAYAERFPSGNKIFELARNQSTGTFNTLWDFFKLGVEHILSGADHILFVISLLLVVISIKEILKLTTAFTLAHSITLIVASIGALTLSSRIVEPMIALSIAFMALATVYLKNTRLEMGGWRKLGIVFFFGLFHGLGFAGLLRDLGVGQSKFLLSLLSFNVGIEAGQLIIILATLPLLYVLRKSAYHETGIKILGTIIGIIGLVWAFERILGLSIGIGPF